MFGVLGRVVVFVLVVGVGWGRRLGLRGLEGECVLWDGGDGARVVPVLGVVCGVLGVGVVLGCLAVGLRDRWWVLLHVGLALGGCIVLFCVGVGHGGLIGRGTVVHCCLGRRRRSGVFLVLAPAKEEEDCQAENDEADDGADDCACNPGFRGR